MQRVSSGKCKACGVRIFWAKKPGGMGWHRPLELVEIPDLIQVVGEEAQPFTAPVFRVHKCSAENLEEAERQRQEWIRTHIPGSNHLRVEVTVPCPRCGAKVNQLCQPLNPEQYKQSVYGDKGHLQNAHKERSALVL